MNAATCLWLIRHAPVDGPRGVIHAADAPADLSDATAFAALKARLPDQAHAVCSPMRRTRQTADRLGLDAVDEVDFAEQDFGAWTGRRHDDLSTELGAAYQEFWKSPAGNRPPGGESFVDQIERARTGLARLPAGDTVLVVHSGTIRAVLAIALELSPDSALRFAIDPLSLTRIDRLASGWRVVAVNQRPA
ncbi:histidine phosphatase family protein [Bradyrhizobium sp. KBS0727]|uniref:histidine phosphatase family protein n=1 Tax=unclassified Bradyrhizobium TaxID=2631580 RepID=UPI00110D4504|nr:MULTISPECIES: histidine phosphatase family protein [unclassified Bradyrhizobium]QDW40937.1 histidine phosphatase family protein [Bradyrhizobium sp. KBS0725]QDW47543.1 histidine phosphatase family protein [Bradyrhizobium sp. KBS0727]